MNKLRYRLSSFFSIPKSQANGLIILIPLCFVIITAPYFYSYLSFEPQDTFNNNTLDSLILALETNVRYKQEEENKRISNPRPYKYSSNAQNRSVKKPTDNNVIKDSFSSNKYNKKEFFKIIPFDINQADTVALKKIKGIGSVLSNRILKYRDLLGGFVNRGQYGEVYGLKDTVIWALDSLALIKEEFQPKIINVNEVNEWTLSKHPYVNRKQAKAIMTYKNQHGDFKSADELFDVKLLDSAMIFKLSPYLDY